jgi:hypothetical protein
MKPEPQDSGFLVCARQGADTFLPDLKRFKHLRINRMIDPMQQIKLN